MGLFANFPIALASGMGLNAVVAFTVKPASGSWQSAMGLIVLDGLVTLVLVLAGLREAIMNAIPRDLRLAIGAGIGLFIAFIGLSHGRLVVPNASFDMPVTFGNFHDPVARPMMELTLVGLFVTSALMALRVRGALIIGILVSTAIAFPLRLTSWPREFALPDLTTAAFHADIRGALRWELIPVLFAVIMVDFFDTLGTATAIAEEAKLADASTGRIPRIRQILIIDSISASIGGLLGVSSNTSYIESAAGVAEGARTGLHSVFVGILFLISIFAAPFAAVVPSAATAPALILVGFLMISQIARIDFENLETAIPAFIVMLTIPLTYSIAHGIGYAFILYVAMNVLSGKGARVHPLMYITAAAFAAYFVWSSV